MSGPAPVLPGLALGRELGRGGEGAVYEIAGRPDLVAKIYHKPADAEKSAKLQAMVRRQSPALLQLAAWPLDTVRDAGGAVVGFVMPRAGGGHDVHDLYSPKSRKKLFPRANIRFLVRAALNIARAVATIHAAGCVIGDINPGGFKVAKNATVRLIDCDSFQISDGGRIYTCNVGVPEFTPPELQNKPFRGLVRTQDHDEFGLAVLLFHLLFLGRHPFAGRWQGAGDMTIARAIGESRFAYGRDRALRQMERPPGTPPIDIYSPGLALMFERSLTAPGLRPSSAEWAAALEAVEAGLVDCPADPDHHQYIHGLASCPWCKIQALTRLQLFAGAARRRTAVAGPPPLPTQAPPATDLAARIEALQPPAPPVLLSRAMLGPMAPRPIPEDRGAWFGALGAVTGALLTSVAKTSANSGAVMLAGAVIIGVSVLYMALRGNGPHRMLHGRKTLLEQRLGRLWHDFSDATHPGAFLQRKDALRALHAAGGQRPAVEAELAALEALALQMAQAAQMLRHQIDAALTELVQTEADIAALRRR